MFCWQTRHRNSHYFPLPSLLTLYLKFHSLSFKSNLRKKKKRVHACTCRWWFMFTVKELERVRPTGTFSLNNKHIVIVWRLQSNNSIFLAHLKWGADVMEMLMTQRSSVKPLLESAPWTYLRKWLYYLPPLEGAQTTQNLLHIIPVIFSSRQTCMFIHSGDFSQYRHCIDSYLRHIYFCTYHSHTYMFNIHVVNWFCNMHSWQYRDLISVK